MLGFGQQTGFHHVENNLAEVAAMANAPLGEHRHHHRAELLEGELPDAIQQFLAAHVPDLAAVFLDDEFLGEVERFANKQVRLAFIARVPAQNELYRFVKLISCMSRLRRLNRRLRRVRGAIPLHRPAGQQQTQDNTKNHLFLPGQAIHDTNLKETGNFGKSG